MKHASTLVLKLALLVMALPAVALCVFAVLFLVRGNTGNFPGEFYAIDIGYFIALIPYFFVLYQAFKLLGYIDNNIAFSELSVQALKKIKYSAFILSGIVLAMEPFLYIMAQQDDAPGIIVLGLVVAFASFIIAVFAAVLERLLHDAIYLKMENDLTV